MKSSTFGVVLSCPPDRPTCLGECPPDPLPAGAGSDDASPEGSDFVPAGFGAAAAPGIAVEFIDSSCLGVSAGFAVSSAKIAGTKRNEVTANVAIPRAPNFTVPPDGAYSMRSESKQPTSPPSTGRRFSSRNFLLISLSFARHGAGTLTTVFTTVTDALSPSALPSSVVIAALPTVENVTPAAAMMVPIMVPPPAALMVAALPICQNTFLACAPPTRITLRGAPGAPTVSVLAVWNTQMAFVSPLPSRVRSEPVIRNEPLAAL